ncbi:MULTISPECIES: hypothetical protein [Nostoc]|uniref:Uncharacterized protein n=1 Tax=Nostoc paludosum FACHB-159 TaxID=2692908 RepID=A0ABR8K5N1_9NOSO|nr:MULTISPECIES: hypothetical protein [Nostoc]MBD2678745.1 hypothetical protein [Nostoc sp. FACHB-857]MBD2734794.1 hypothetical protein [Nostoc paludosum FACHB-159]
MLIFTAKLAIYPHRILNFLIALGKYIGLLIPRQVIAILVSSSELGVGNPDEGEFLNAEERKVSAESRRVFLKLIRYGLVKSCTNLHLEII